MRPILADLLKLLELERIEDRIFRGESRDLGGARVFGGQVLGQALTAASYTVQDRQVHSLHAYFLVAGDVNAPIVYEVDVARDGKSFSNRRVVAIQHGQPIFNMTASFQVPEEGLEHADADAAGAGAGRLGRRARAAARRAREGSGEDAALPHARAAVRVSARGADSRDRAAARPRPCATSG